MKTLGWRTGTPLGRSGMGITIPIEIGEVYRNRKKITQNTISISKKKRTERNGKKIPFIPDWAHRKQERNNAGKYKTVAIEEEDKTTIGFMREHDTDPRPEISTNNKNQPKGIPNRNRKTIKANRASIRNVTKWKGRILGMTEYNYLNPKEWTL